MPISNWSNVSADNDDSDLSSGINLAEGQAPGSLNDSMRSLMSVIKQDWTAAGLEVLAANPLSAAWTNYSPTMASSTVSLTGTCNGRYKKIGRTVHVAIYAIISTGTGGTFVASLPFTAAAAGLSYAGSGMLTNTGAALSVVLGSGGFQINALRADATSPVAPGSVLAISITYEAAS